MDAPDLTEQPSIESAGIAVSPSHLRAALDGVRGGLVTVGGDLGIGLATRGLGRLLRIHDRVVARATVLEVLLEASPILPAEAVAEMVAAVRATIADGTERSVLFEIADDGRVCQIGLRVAVLADRTWLLAFEEVADRPAASGGGIVASSHDAVTGLPDRRLFERRAAAWLGGTPGGDRQAGDAILLVDLDRFKPVNETLGHAVGDGLLLTVARRLRGIVRSADIVARLGGDQFAVLATQVPDRPTLTALATRIIDLLGRPYLIGGNPINIGACVGMAFSPDDGEVYETLLRNAHLALNDAKRGRGNSFRFFKPEMDRRASSRRTLEIDLRKALALQQFELHYQPQIDVDSRTIVGFEALLRWRHPERGMVSPADFIPIAEEIGLIVPLGEWVLAEASREAMRWPDEVSVAVNVSAHQFEDPARLAHSVVHALHRSGLPSRRLEIEITESALLRNETAVMGLLQEFRSMGVRVAMDDFGTGYSSLSQLRSFPFDKIKIDRSFVTDGGDSVSQDAIIRAINALCISLGMSTIAEGVETAEQLERIRDSGCRLVQGFLFGRPVGNAEAVRLIAECRSRTLAGRPTEGTE